MTLGFVCDGPCEQFWPGRTLGAEITFHCFADDDGRAMPAVTTHICPECVIGLLSEYGPAPRHMVLADHDAEQETE